MLDHVTYWVVISSKVCKKRLISSVPICADFAATYLGSYIYGRWNFLALILRNLLYFISKKSFLYILGNGNPKTELSYISGNGNSKNLPIFQEVTFQTKKNKKKTSARNRTF